MVSTPRRQLSVELGVGALQRRIPGDFVDAGVRKGGSTILLGKVLEEFDGGGE